MTGAAADRGTLFWRLVFRAAYRFLRVVDPLIRRMWRTQPGGPMDRVVELDVAGQRTGRARSVIVTGLTVNGREYIGHPNGNAAWTRNVEAAGSLNVVAANGSGRQMRAIRLGPGPERESVIRATWSQQPFPANLLYSAARGHVRRVGVYFRLEPIAGISASREPGA